MHAYRLLCLLTITLIQCLTPALPMTRSPIFTSTLYIPSTTRSNPKTRFAFVVTRGGAVSKKEGKDVSKNGEVASGVGTKLTKTKAVKTEKIDGNSPTLNGSKPNPRNGVKKGSDESKLNGDSDIDTDDEEDYDKLAQEEEEDEVPGYDSLGSLSKQIKSLREYIHLPLKHPEIYDTLGLDPPKGILLVGPSGSGKTSLAKAVAKEVGAFYFHQDAPGIMSKKAGESELNLKRIFDKIISEAKNEDFNGAVLVIDDIDSICPSRQSQKTSDSEKRIVTQLIHLLDNLKKDSRVIVIGVTSKPSILDPALRRPGRFDKEIDLGVPDVAGRLEILKIKTKDMSLGKDVDLTSLAKETHGFVGADIQQLGMEAAMNAIREKIPTNGLDFEEEEMGKNDALLVNKNHFTEAIKVVNPSSLRENQVEVPDVKWSDVGGLEDVKVELQETVQYPVEHADKFIKFGMNPSKGVLFYGPPGCGKTLLAKAIANECGANFISIKGPELLTMWFGESEANVRQLFDKARAAAPCILMFDEIDSIAKARGSGGGGGGSEASDRVINQILTEIDGVGARKNVFVIGATNRPDILDPAVIRPGRLDQLIYIPLPDYASRLSIFRACLRKSPVAVDVKLEVLAKSTAGFSGADISEICRTASKMAIREVILKDEAKKKLEKEVGWAKNDGSKKSSFGALFDEGRSEPSVENRYETKDLAITKKHFNFAMSKARKSVTETDLRLFQKFAEKQKVGREKKPRTLNST